MPGRATQAASSSPQVSLVLPGYNPGNEIETTWREVESFLNEQRDAWEVVFVLDGCTDGSPERLRELTRSHADRVRVLSYAPNRGKGYAVRYGLAEARGAWRIFTDFDLAYGWDDVRRLARCLQEGADFAIASRQHPDSRINLPSSLQGYIYRRHLQSVLFVSLAHLLLPIRQPDPQAGLKGMSARVAEQLLPHLQCNGFSLDCELLTACARLDIAVAEIPVTVQYRDRASTTGLVSVLRMVRELWSIGRRWRQTPTQDTSAPMPGAREAA